MDEGRNIKSNIQVALVSGATGFIGSYLTRQLCLQGYNVIVYARNSYPTELRSQASSIKWIVGDLNDLRALSAACEGVDVVFHLAGLAHSNNVNRHEIFKVNLQGTKNLYSACSSAGVKKFIYFSSILASEPNRSVYAESKRAAEQYLLLSRTQHYEPQVVILRPANVYGPEMRGNLRRFILLARKGLLPALPRLTNPLALVSVRDLCVASIMAAEAEFPLDSNIYTVTDGERYTPNRIEDAVYEGIGIKRPSWRVPKLLLLIGAIFATVLNVTRIRSNQLGLRLYRNLVNSKTAGCEESIPPFRFKPTATLESEMETIINSLKADKP